MKKIITIIILTLSIISTSSRCSDYVDDPLANIEVGEMYDYKFDDSEIPDFESVEEYRRFVHENIFYKDEKIDYWQLPEETLKLKTGDCEDMNILFMYLIETRLKFKTKMFLVYNGSFQHVVVKVEDKNLYYDIVNNFTADRILEGWRTIYIIPYLEIIWMTYYYHDNVGKYR